MSHHRDIGNAYAKLEGEGWHIEYHFEAEYKSAKEEGVKNDFISIIAFVIMHTFHVWV